MWNIWSFYELDVPWFLTFYHVSRYIYIGSDNAFKGLSGMRPLTPEDF